MNRKALLIIPIIITIPLIVYSLILETEKKSINTNPDLEEKQLIPSQISDEKLIPKQYTELHNENLLFRAYAPLEKSVEKDGEIVYSEGMITGKSEFYELYDEVGVRTDHQNTVVIYPIFTASAYKSPGFYDYYNKRCDESCLTTEVVATLDHNNSGIGVQVLLLLGYEVVNDVYVHNNPEKIERL